MIITLQTVEEVRKTIEILTGVEAKLVQTESYSDVYSNGMIFHLSRHEDYETKKTSGWTVSGVTRDQ